MLSASNCLSTTWHDTLTEIREDEEQWKKLLDMELEACLRGLVTRAEQRRDEFLGITLNGANEAITQCSGGQIRTLSRYGLVILLPVVLRNYKWDFEC